MSCEYKLTNLVFKNKMNSARTQCASFFLPFFPLYIYIYIYICKKKKLRMKCMNVVQCNSQRQKRKTQKPRNKEQWLQRKSNEAQRPCQKDSVSLSLFDMVLMLHCFSFVTIVLCSLVFVSFFCLLELHCITFMHFILGVFSFFLYIKKKKFKRRKKGRKKEAHCVLALFSLFLKTRLVNLFSHDMSIVLCLALTSLFIALYQLKLCSACCVGKMFMVFITLS